MSNIRHPFASYPFNEKKLDPALRELIEHLVFYKTAREIHRIIIQKNLTDSNTHLCWAYFEWMDAMATELDSEILSCGESALAIIEDILTKDPEHKPTQKLKKYIEKEVNKIHKANKKFEKFNKVPLESLSLSDVSDFAWFLMENKRDKASKEIELKLWTRLYEEKPDTSVMKGEDDDKPDIHFHGSKYYCLFFIARVLWEGLDRYEEARPILWKLIDWDKPEDVDLYNWTTSCLLFLLFESIEKNDQKEFSRLLQYSERKYLEINTYRKSIGKSDDVIPIVYEPDLGKLLTFALEINDREAIKYILDSMCTEKEFVIAIPEVKKMIALARALT